MAIKETSRLTDQKVELDEYEKQVLNERLQILIANLKEEPEISITFFVPYELPIREMMKKAVKAFVV